MDSFRFRDFDPTVQAFCAVTAVLFITAASLAVWCVYWAVAAFLGGL